MAGYSGTPLPQKLGIKEGHAVALVGAPPKFSLGDVPAKVVTRLGAGPYDVLVVFVTVRGELAAQIAGARAKMTEAGGLWIAWPKKSSGVATDMTEQAIRDVALPTGLVDNKVCAIDSTWSGLRLVIRRELRREGRRELRGAPPKTPRRASARSTGR
jgi:hypothetical protein